MEIEVIRALPDNFIRRSLQLEAGATVAQARALCADMDGFAQMDVSLASAAVWGEVVADSQVLSEGDRLEWLVPLPVDPKEARRRRAAEQREG